ncbi:Kynurenine/alpha-aminoadipate aminotransferase, mitochondrial [Termitomyces sp. J132]|nr:Kynurenine/alpha-aminoadipate aminotransferase, mitochondrial [Termitomyces sp. J132]
MNVDPTFQAPAKALPVDYYTPFLSDLAKRRKPSAIRSLFPLEHTPGLISLLAGKPNPTTFPFTSFSFTAESPTKGEADVEVKIGSTELAHGLQYGATAGYEKLWEWFVGLQEFVHCRKKTEDWSISIGSGSQDLIYKILISPKGCRCTRKSRRSCPCRVSSLCVEVETDAHGIKSSSLRSILEEWPVGKPKPRVLYTVPYGCNPTGMTATLERRKEVLALSREHDFIILEDDPYYYLYYGTAPRYPSYFNLEMEEPQTGRVLRFDSLSKILSAGIRIGFASGPKPLLDAINKHTATSNLQTASLTQVIVYKLLETWGYDTFIQHTKKVSNFYREKRDVFEAAMKKHLTGLAEWVAPEAGMFFWFKLLLTDDPSVEGDSQALIAEKAVKSGVLALPGTAFLPNDRKTAHVRAAFSLLSEEDVNEALRRLSKVIKDART